MPFDPNEYLSNDLKSQPATGFDPQAYIAQQAPTLQNGARAAADPTGNSQFYPDTNIGKGELAATQAVAGATGMNANEAAKSGLEQMRRDNLISTQDYQQQKSDQKAGPSQYSQELETAKSENPTLSAASNLAGQGAQIAATQPAIDTAGTAAFRLGADGLKEASQVLSTKAIPNLNKYLSKIGGLPGVEKLGQVLDDYGVTDAPRTLRKLGNKVGEVVKAVGTKLRAGYTALDEAVQAAIPGKDAKDAIFNSWASTYKESAGIEPPKSLQGLAHAAIEDRINDQQLYTHTEFADMATDIQKKAWDRANLDASKVNVQIGFAFRKANLDLALKSGAPGDLVQDVMASSSAYNKIKTADFAIEKKLARSSAFSKTLAFVQHASAATIGSLTGMGSLAAVGDAAYTVGSSTLGATGGAAASKLGSRLLSTAADMGPWQKTMLTIAARKGIKGLQEWHLGQMLDNQKYADAYHNAVDQSENK